MATAVSKAIASAKPSLFRVGSKKVYLPNHVLTFVEPKENQPPTYATFKVPLRFNKLDMRDYLFHVYNVEVRSVRSFINGAALRKHKQSLDAYNGFINTNTYRPQSQKMMTVELVKPFLFPKTPKDLKPWDGELFRRMNDSQEAKEAEMKMVQKSRTKFVMPSDRPVSMERIAVAKEAQKLREGQQEWTNDLILDEKWVEVEKDVALPPKK